MLQEKQASGVPLEAEELTKMGQQESMEAEVKQLEQVLQALQGSNT
jgi:hypothetical protein